MKKFLLVIALVAMTVIVVGFLLPQTTHVERKITINSDRQTVYAFLNTMANFNRWSPWYALDPDASYSYSGPDAGVGATMVWKSQDQTVGEGSQKIIASTIDEGIKMLLKFGEQQDAWALYYLEADGERTHVTWSFDMDMGYNIFGRYMGLMMDNMLGTTYEQGLEQLKRILEEGAQ